MFELDRERVMVWGPVVNHNYAIRGGFAPVTEADHL
jgi:hypothetical protein